MLARALTRSLIRPIAARHRLVAAVAAAAPPSSAVWRTILPRQIRRSFSDRPPKDPNDPESGTIRPPDSSVPEPPEGNSRTTPETSSTASSASPSSGKAPRPPPPQLPELGEDLFLSKAEAPSGVGGGSGGGREGLPKSAYISSTDRKRERLARVLFGSILASILGGTLYLGRELSEEERRHYKDVPSGWGASQFSARLRARTRDWLKFYNEPPFDKLLPEQYPDYGRPYTLVISLEDLCVHSTWDREHGWRIAKRPGLDYFLAYLFQYYEIVVFTSQHEQTAFPIIQKMDQYPGYIIFQLFRAHTRYTDGKYIKDLNYLNRDLSKVVMLETNPDAWSANPSNTIKMKPWKGDPNDKELIALIPFLEYIAAMGVQDVRPVIDGFGDKHVPTEFARREAIARAEHQKRVEEERKQRRGTIGGAMLAGLGMGQPNARDERMPMDIARERGLQAYHDTQKHIEDHKEEMLKEQQKAEKEAAEMMKTSLTKIFTEVPPLPHSTSYPPF